MAGSSTRKTALSALQFLKPPHILIVEARFYEDVNDMLLEGVADTLKELGATWEKFTVPGSLEIPAAVQFGALRQNGRAFDAFIVLGCVIRGATFHFEIVAGESTRGLTDVALKHNLAVGNCILTCEDKEQALERADKNRMNKGGDAAVAALSMLHLKQICGVE